jgi:hypothetical protein
LRIVREGLKPGDVIVVNGAQRVHPGLTVAPQRVTMGGDEPAQGASTSGVSTPGASTPGASTSGVS